MARSARPGGGASPSGEAGPGRGQRGRRGGCAEAAEGRGAGGAKRGGAWALGGPQPGAGQVGRGLGQEGAGGWAWAGPGGGSGPQPGAGPSGRDLGLGRACWAAGWEFSAFRPLAFTVKAISGKLVSTKGLLKFEVVS